MKSRFSALFFAIITLVCIGFFAVTNQAFAAVTSQERDQIISQDIPNFYNVTLAAELSPSKSSLIKRHTELFNQQYNQLKDADGMTSLILQAYAIDAMQKDIDETITELDASPSATQVISCANLICASIAAIKAVLNPNKSRDLKIIKSQLQAKYQYLLAQASVDNGSIDKDQQKQIQDAASQQNNKTTSDALNGDATTCNPNPLASGRFDILSCVSSVVTWIIRTILFGFAQIFVFFFAQLFHYSIFYGILNFSSSFGIGGVLLYPLWQTVRDIVNIIVIFFILGAVIVYLVNQGDKIKKLVPWLILYALFVNFSWVASRTIVDYSNILTLQVYNVIAPDALDINSQRTPGFILMENLGLQGGIMKVNQIDGQQTPIDKTNHPGIALLFVAMAFYTAYIFFVASIIFMLRTALLVFFIIASPFLLLDAVLPWVGEYASKARNMFFSQLAVGPVFMIFLFLTTQIMATVRKGLESLQATESTGTQGTPLLFFGTVLMLILLTVMIKVTKKLSGAMGEKISGFAGSALMTVAGGGAGLALRGTVGAAASRFAGSQYLDRIQHTAIGRGIKSSADKLATGTYDFRNLKPIQATAGMAGVALGKPLTQGYKQSFDEKDKEFNAKADSIKDEATKAVFIENQRIGWKGLRGDADKVKPNNAAGDYRSSGALIAEKRILEDYKKASRDERINTYLKSNTGLQSKMAEIDVKEEKDRKKRAADIAETEQMKREARRVAQGEDQTETLHNNIRNIPPNAMGNLVSQLQNMQNTSAPTTAPTSSQASSTAAPTIQPSTTQATAQTTPTATQTTPTLAPRAQIIQNISNQTTINNQPANTPSQSQSTQPEAQATVNETILGPDGQPIRRVAVREEPESSPLRAAS